MLNWKMPFTSDSMQPYMPLIGKAKPHVGLPTGDPFKIARDRIESVYSFQTGKTLMLPPPLPILKLEAVKKNKSQKLFTLVM
jgi:hypothetical protein